MVELLQELFAKIDTDNSGSLEVSRYSIDVYSMLVSVHVDLTLICAVNFSWQSSRSFFWTPEYRISTCRSAPTLIFHLNSKTKPPEARRVRALALHGFIDR